MSDLMVFGTVAPLAGRLDFEHRPFKEACKRSGAANPSHAGKVKRCASGTSREVVSFFVHALAPMEIGAWAQSR